MSELERIAVQLKALGYLRLAIDHRCFQQLDHRDFTCLWVPVGLWTPEMHASNGSDTEWVSATLWCADNDLTGDELRAGKGMYFEDPIVAAVWLKTEASVKP